MVKLLMIGAGLGLIETLPIVNALNRKHKNFEIIGALDDRVELQGKSVIGIKILGLIKDWRTFSDDIKFVFCIGSYTNRLTRKNILEDNKLPRERFTTLIHPNTDIMVDSKSIGFGTIIHGGVIVYPQTIIGDFCAFSAASVIGVDNVIGSFSLVAARVTSATEVVLGSCSFVGSGSIIAPKVILGCGSLVGVGSVVFRDIQPGHKVIGNPAKPYGRDDISTELAEYSNKDEVHLRYLKS